MYFTGMLEQLAIANDAISSLTVEHTRAKDIVCLLLSAIVVLFFFQTKITVIILTTKKCIHNQAQHEPSDEATPPN